MTPNEHQPGKHGYLGYSNPHNAQKNSLSASSYKYFLPRCSSFKLKQTNKQTNKQTPQ